MAEKTLQGFRVAILATDGFEESELAKPRAALEEAGAECRVVAPHDGTIYGMKHHDKADMVKVDVTLDALDANDFDGALLPGGVINADALRVEEKAKDFVEALENAGKPIAVICHGPWLLVSADLVHQHLLTSWPSVQDDIANAGGRWEDKEVIRDKNWVSSRKPDDIPAFNREMIRLFEEHKSSQVNRPGSRMEKIA
ncbi:MAG TPA: type 1 glutamine amidotransferase domain-containing protein [Terriglobales bacterium]|nr:type 1 glutamine amidotransferase domain-containing protein [Terriglobales bacterium]